MGHRCERAPWASDFKGKANTAARIVKQARRCCSALAALVFRLRHLVPAVIACAPHHEAFAQWCGADTPRMKPSAQSWARTSASAMRRGSGRATATRAAQDRLPIGLDGRRRKRADTRACAMAERQADLIRATGCRRPLARAACGRSRGPGRQVGGEAHRTARRQCDLLCPVRARRRRRGRPIVGRSPGLAGARDLDRLSDGPTQPTFLGRRLRDIGQHIAADVSKSSKSGRARPALEIP